MFVIRKAERKQRKLRLALSGIQHAGKTYSAIKLAKGMGYDGKFIIIDTESSSSTLFDKEANYDFLDLHPKFTTDRYIEAITQCENAGYKLIIIDSLSHAWEGTGGLLELHKSVTNASKSKNSYVAWNDVKPFNRKLFDKIQRSPAHIICCMRAKSHIEIENCKPVYIGMKAIQEEAANYEFDIMLGLQHKTHFYEVLKDRTDIFKDIMDFSEKITEKTGEILIEWLNNGKSIEQYNQELLQRIDGVFESCSSENELRIKYEEFWKDYQELRIELREIKNKHKARFADTDKKPEIDDEQELQLDLAMQAQKPNIMQVVQ